VVLLYARQEGLIKGPEKYTRCLKSSGRKKASQACDGRENAGQEETPKWRKKRLYELISSTKEEKKTRPRWGEERERSHAASQYVKRRVGETEHAPRTANGKGKKKLIED